MQRTASPPQSPLLDCVWSSCRRRQTTSLSLSGPLALKAHTFSHWYRDPVSFHSVSGLQQAPMCEAGVLEDSSSCPGVQNWQQPDSKLPKNNWEYVIVCLAVNRIIRSCRFSDKMVSKFPAAKKRVSSSCMPSESVVPPAVMLNLGRSLGMWNLQN